MISWPTSPEFQQKLTKETKLRASPLVLFVFDQIR